MDAELAEQRRFHTDGMKDADTFDRTKYDYKDAEKKAANWVKKKLKAGLTMPTGYSIFTGLAGLETTATGSGTTATGSGTTATASRATTATAKRPTTATGSTQPRQKRSRAA